MGMVVQHNLNALSAYNKLNTNVAGLKKSSEKLSSGYRINRAGDDAAGLAISEKMRSQIRGLNQAVRNSQDGINMIQTYEGALQESHSILQRMKELASESANGTYQNEVDRDAIQLEFNQLNDELNQIADTDFNGTVMLNGGQMADGTKAVNGQFDYVDGTKAATKLSKSDVSVLDEQDWNNAAAKALATNKSGSATKANNAWAALNGSWSRTPGKANETGPDSVDVTFKYDSSNGSWSVVSASDGADKSKIFTKSTANGGFEVSIGGASGTAATAYAAGDKVANVVLDSTKLGNGDTITLTFKNPATGIKAPTNAGATVTDSTNFTEGTDTKALKLNAADLTVTNGITSDAAMTEDIQELINQINGGSLQLNYKNDVTAAGDMSISLANGTTLTSSTASNPVTIGDTTFTFEFTAADNKLEIKSGTTVLFTLQGAKQDTAATAPDTLSTGSISYKVSIEAGKYDAAATPTVEVAKTGNVSKANSNNAATSPLTYTDHLVLQTGARTKDSVDFTFEYSTDGMGELKSNLNVSSRADGLNTANLSLATQTDANAAIDKIDNAINKVSMVRATFGATQNRLEHKIDNLTTTSTNLTEAESSIRDTDMASEMMTYTKFNILQQAAQSMLAQANQQPQSILQLLG